MNGDLQVHEAIQTEMGFRTFVVEKMGRMDERLKRIEEEKDGPGSAVHCRLQDEKIDGIKDELRMYRRVSLTSLLGILAFLGKEAFEKVFGK